MRKFFEQCCSMFDAYQWQSILRWALTCGYLMAVIICTSDAWLLGLGLLSCIFALHLAHLRLMQLMRRYNTPENKADYLADAWSRPSWPFEASTDPDVQFATYHDPHIAAELAITVDHYHTDNVEVHNWQGFNLADLPATVHPLRLGDARVVERRVHILQARCVTANVITVRDGRTSCVHIHPEYQYARDCVEEKHLSHKICLHPLVINNMVGWQTVGYSFHNTEEYESVKILEHHTATLLLVVGEATLRGIDITTYDECPGFATAATQGSGGVALPPPIDDGRYLYMDGDERVM